ncbi:transposase [Thiolapillus sp.]
MGGILRELCRQQGVELIEGYAMRDHIHMLLMIPPNTVWQTPSVF